MPSTAAISPRPTYLFTSIELLSVANVTHRQLQWWDEHDLVKPCICEHKRLYTWAQALEVCIVSELRRKSLSMHKVRNVIGSLRARLKLRRYATDVYLLTDGHYLELADSSHLPLSVCQAPRAVVVVSLGALEERLAANA